ncbi:hypothetical protein GWR56_06465 [Mucilaginibacter sp. 14171R-50]|uniref:hypothetical protein n=1 Tax=Mucilaginibacter sp. 14171R-50 TaxID=2703789 RepID=UPI00138D1976|nr:hypothetical protein [Mucilaginibacter sp. 14171R-50]QHS55199.1 hypothetical protein GWR56_06465 [Mucilaginibacter sp. 14171R-50]
MKTTHHLTLLCGLILIALCSVIRYQIGRRRFNRRGVGGLQHFHTYQKYVVVTTLERIIMIVANLCGLAGLVLLAVAGINHLKF